MLRKAFAVRAYAGESALRRTAIAVRAGLQQPITQSQSNSMSEDNTTAKNPRIDEDAAKPGTADQVCWPH